MKTIKRYNSFEELESAEKGASDRKISLKKHSILMALLQKIYAAKSKEKTILNQPALNGR